MRTIALRASLLHVRKREAVSGKAGFVAKDTVTAIGRCQGKRIMKKCVFAGTFDPPTLGHRAVVERAKKVFDEVIVAILVNPDKKPLFTVAERMELLKKTMPFAEVKIISSEKTRCGLLSARNQKRHGCRLRNRELLRKRKTLRRIYRYVCALPAGFIARIVFGGTRDSEIREKRGRLRRGRGERFAACIVRREKARRNFREKRLICAAKKRKKHW